MEGRGWIGRHGFWPLALLWLPAGIVAQVAVRFGWTDAVAAGRLGPWPATMAMEGLTLAPFVPCGLPLALGSWRLWRLGYRRGDGGGDATGRAAQSALDRGSRRCGRLPVWIVWWWLGWRD